MSLPTTVPADAESTSKHVSEVTLDHQTATEPTQAGPEDPQNQWTALTIAIICYSEKC